MNTPATPRRHSPTNESELDGTSRRSCLRALSLAPLAAALAACGGGSVEEPAGTAPGDASVDQEASAATPTSRRWYMGFSSAPPRPDVDSFLTNLSLWSQRADLAAIQYDVPWAALLDGVPPDTLLTNDQLGLVNHYRSLGLKVLLSPELNDGLARESDALALRALGRSLTEPAVQAVAVNYLLAAARILRPDWLCLGVETNLVRLVAPRALYDAVKRCANDAAAAVKAAGLTNPPILTTVVQVETAWGRMPGQNGTFVGIAADRSDFPFAQCLGLTSYPYMAYRKPEDIPANWYKRVIGSVGLPVMVTECGWPSAPTPVGTSNTDLQRRYIERHFTLLSGIGAAAVVHTHFADIDVSAWPPPHPDSLQFFTSIGLCTSDFSAKPALSSWDRQFSLTLSKSSV